MLTQSNTSKNNESLKNKINKNNIPVNRGVELILSGGKKKRKPTPIGRYRTRVTWMKKSES